MDVSVYRRPDKPLMKVVEKRRRFSDGTSTVSAPTRLCDLSVDSSTECHVTPPVVAKRMFEYAVDFGAKVTDRWADPQCGTGNLIQAMLDGGVSSNLIVGVERHIKLADFCRSRFEATVNVITGCFLESHSEMTQVNVVLTNPPFKSAYKQLAATVNLVKQGGVIIALVPVTFDWPGMIELERLPKGTFVTTDVQTKIVAIC